MHHGFSACEHKNRKDYSLLIVTWNELNIAEIEVLYGFHILKYEACIPWVISVMAGWIFMLFFAYITV